MGGINQNGNYLMDCRFNKTELIARIRNLLINKDSRKKWILQQDDLLIDSESSDVKLLKKIENTVIENLSDENFKSLYISQLTKHALRRSFGYLIFQALPHDNHYTICVPF